MNLRYATVLSLLVGVISVFAQTPQTEFQIDLQSHGWKLDRRVLNGSTLPYTVDFADDDSLWVVFPAETAEGLQSRDVRSEYRGKVLHITPSGEVSAGCDTAHLAWNYVMLIAHRSDGFTLGTAHELIAFDGRCKQKSSHPTTSKTNITPSPNRGVIYLSDNTPRVSILSNEDLSKMKEFDLPEQTSGKHVLFGDEMAAFPNTVHTKGCWRDEFSKMTIATGQVAPWTTIECARYNLLGDEHVIYTSLNGDSSLEITGGSGVPSSKYTPPRNMYVDRAVIDRNPVESSQSLRVVEELIETKGRHPSLDMSGKFVGREIVLLDMHTGTALLTIKVPMDTLTYSYALSRDGKKLAVLLNSQVSVYKVP